jgi:hypothetical protein
MEIGNNEFEDFDDLDTLESDFEDEFEDWGDEFEQE